MSNLLVMLISNVLVRALGIVSFVLARRWLGPESSGVWGLVQTITGYLVAIGVGTGFGAEREIPFLRGRGERKKADDIRNQTFTTTLSEALLISGGTVIFTYFFWDRLDPRLSTGLLWGAAHVFLWRMSEFFSVSLRTIQAFPMLGRANVVLALMDLATVAFSVHALKLTGQYLAVTLSLSLRLLVFVGYVNREKLFEVHWRWKTSDLSALAFIGIPLVVNNILWQLMGSMDVLIIAQRWDLNHLGLYTMGVSAGRLLGEILAALSMVFSPYVLTSFGSHQDLSKLETSIHRSIKVTFWLVIPVLFVGAFVGTPIALRLFLPEFETGMPSIRILILSGIILSATSFPAQVFLACKKTHWMLVLSGSMCATMVVAVSMAAPHGIFVTAVTGLCVRYIFFALTVVFASRLTTPGMLGLRRSGEVVLSAGYVIGVPLISHGIVSRVRSHSIIVESSIELFVMGVLYLPMIKHVWDEFDFKSHFNGLLLKRRNS